MKVAQWAVDWKEDFAFKDINRLATLVGGKKLMHDYAQDCVDSKVMFISSHELTYEQLDELWRIGDLWCDDVISGKNFAEVKKNLRKANKEWAKEGT